MLVNVHGRSGWRRRQTSDKTRRNPRHGLSAARSSLPTFISMVRGSIETSRSPRARGFFEFCDYAATTFTMNFCSGYVSEIADERRSRYYNSLKSSMTGDELAAFATLLAAQNAYIEVHASEVDQGGTIRVIRTVGSQRILKDLFHTDVVHFEGKKWPVLSESQITTADALLHREYVKKLQQLRTQSKESIDQGSVTADHLSSVEETWQ